MTDANAQQHLPTAIAAVSMTVYCIGSANVAWHELAFANWPGIVGLLTGG